MKLIAPQYYPAFRCTAGACRHSCCFGWEIGIDADTLAFYRTVPGELGKKLAENISLAEDGPCFRLTPDERCPFWGRDGLCGIITALGEDRLCQICADHPRFRNFFSGRTEIGLGLCCEAAGRLILGASQPMDLLVLEDGGEEEPLSREEQAFLSLRDRVFSLLQDRAVPLEERVRRMLSVCGGAVPEKSPAEWAELYRGLERLDPAWDSVLLGLRGLPSGGRRELCSWDTAWDQLLVYFIYRHLAGALDDGRLSARAAFAAQSLFLIQDLCAVHLRSHGQLVLDDVVEAARLYSSEVEYSEENLQALLTIFQKGETL